MDEQSNLTQFAVKTALQRMRLLLHLFHVCGITCRSSVIAIDKAQRKGWSEICLCCWPVVLWMFYASYLEVIT